jgi:glycosyltransferase involved in cell wall biosynthesis
VSDLGQSNVYIVIAAFRESQAVAEVVRGLREQWPRVVVVDDGSEDGTAQVAAEAGATVLRHVINRGQGAALQTGISHALHCGAKAIVTFDADGQHSVADIARLLEPILAGRVEVTLGSRFLGNSASVPFLRRVLLRAAVVFTRVFSGAQLTDAHNGLRAFSRRGAESLDIRLDRMAHASEIIDQIIDSGLAYEEVPVSVRYTPYSRAKGQTGGAALRIVWDYMLSKVVS